MKIALLGTGSVTQTLAPVLLQHGHTIVVGTRNPEETLRRTEPDRWGMPGAGTFFARNPNVTLSTFSQAVEGADLMFNATSGAGSIEALRSVGAAALKGKILLDLSNPLDFSKGFPPTLSVCNDDSLGERIQAAFPETKVVKTLNTMAATWMLNPSALAGGDHSVFVSGNDASAKKLVVDFLKSFGWKDVIDLGDITTARGTEMILPLWLRVMNSLGNGNFNFKISR